MTLRAFIAALAARGCTDVTLLRHEGQWHATARLGRQRRVVAGIDAESALLGLVSEAPAEAEVVQ